MEAHTLQVSRASRDWSPYNLPDTLTWISPSEKLSLRKKRGPLERLGQRSVREFLVSTDGAARLNATSFTLASRTEWIKALRKQTVAPSDGHFLPIRIYDEVPAKPGSSQTFEALGTQADFGYTW
jgi:hypothetical protein